MIDIAGKSLFFRVYDDGYCEFEAPDENKIHQTRQSRSEEVNVLRRINVTENELIQIKTLLDEIGRSNIMESYKRTCCCTDTSLNFDVGLRIADRNSRTELKNFCDISEIRKASISESPSVDQTLAKLITVLDDLRSKYNNVPITPMEVSSFNRFSALN